MFAHIHYITPHTSPIGYANDLAHKDLFCSYIFDLNDSGKQQSLFQSLFNLADLSPFSITLKLPEELPLADWDELWFERVSVLLCHPRYITYAGKHLVGFNFADDTVMDQQIKFVTRLDYLLLTQGLSILPIPNIPQVDQNASAAILKDPDWIEQITAASFYDYYVHQIAKEELPVNFFCFFHSPHLISKIAQLKGQAEDNLAENEPRFFGLLTKYSNKSSELKKLEGKFKQLSDSHKSLQKNHDLLLGKFDTPGAVGSSRMNEVMKIKKFYYNEYEILPLWYKRFGHIIKVLMGKRTFRSLFDNNVKKYKE